MLFGRDRICAVVAASSPEEVVRQLRIALRHTRTIELRLDWLKTHRGRLAVLGSLVRLRARAQIIATCRRREAGGRFPGSVVAQIALLIRAVAAGCRWCDIEIETAELFRTGFLKTCLYPARVLVSWHDFRRTPPQREIEAAVRRLTHGGAIKLAAQSSSIRDSLRVLEAARGRRNVVAVPMGEAALPARILALRQGSALAYAATSEVTAPGQPMLEEMKCLYRADRLDRKTRVYGVIGKPIGHSLSPLMHNAAFQARRMNAVYLPFEVEDPREFIGAIPQLGVAGFSVTVPHKERILRYLNDCDPLARKIGAVNTVVVRGGRTLYGYNTDYVGALRALERRARLEGSRVLVYGAGGAARAVAFALAQGGAAVCVCARRSERAKALARAVGGEALGRPRLRHEFFDAIVNATPVGMYPRGGTPLAPRELNCRLVMDLIYRPMKTPLLQMARHLGRETISGLEMFLAQGTAQWEIWTGVRAPYAAMRRAVLQALRREARARRIP